MRKRKHVPVVVGIMLSILLPACATEEPAGEVLDELASSFVYDALALSPITATAVGYHEHKLGGAEGDESGTVVHLDELLDDYSPAGISKRTNFYRDFQARLHGEIENRDRLAGDDWVDYGVLSYNIDQAIVELEQIRSHEHNPNLYVELVGMAIYTPLVHEYAPKTERYRHIIARLEKVPEFLDQAKGNLQSSPEVWTEVAQEDTAGLINLISEVIPASLPEELSDDYEAAAGSALEALRGFSDYLSNDLANRTQHDWRLGRELYTAKFQAAMGAHHTVEKVLAEAEQEFQRVRNDAIQVGEALDKEIFGSARPPSDKLKLMNGVLEIVADENRLRSPDGLMDRIKGDIEELQKFVRDANLVALPNTDNLQIVETPEFMRGVYSVAGFMPPPPLTSELDAYYWVTPIPSDWSRARVLSKLREYNFFQLKLLSLHEVMPGHYVQFELAHEGQEGENPLRRILRTVFPNGPHVEGWATYITEAMVTSGYYEDNQGFQVNWQKLKLRAIANAILDIRLHTMNMTDEEALDLLENQAFQETEEARSKLLRAKLTSAQLPLYYVGWKDWLRVRDHYQNETNDFSLSSFHGKALRSGPVPLRELGYLISERPMAD